MEKLDLAYWKGMLQNFLNVRVQNRFTKKMIHHARRRIANIEAKVLVKVACMLIAVATLTGCVPRLAVYDKYADPRITKAVAKTKIGNLLQTIGVVNPLIIEQIKQSAPAQSEELTDDLTWMVAAEARLKAKQEGN